MQPLSIKEISRQIGLEESLLRFYESEYGSEFPAKVLQGDVLLFEPRALEVFRQIHARHHQAAPRPKPEAEADSRYGRVIGITSGKGGVGKTNLALNLAIEFQRQGRMTVVLDGDLGMANIHLLAGVNPVATLTEIVTSNRNISEVIIPGPAGIGIIPGGSGIMAMADSNRGDREKIIRALAEVEQNADVVLVDTGGGMGAAVRDFLGAVDELLFVLTPDITSLTDAYGLLKAVWAESKRQRPIYAVVNMAVSLQQAADTARRFALCARQFLGVEVRSIGYIMKDATVGAATVRRTPYTIFKPKARVSLNTRQVAMALLQHEDPAIHLNSAFSRYQKMINP